MNRNSLLRKPLGFEGKFTQFPNAWARDERIGFRAKGVLILLMSHTDGWQISLQHLAGISRDGITAIRTAVQELEEAGYLERQLIRNDKSQVEASEWVLSDPFEIEQTSQKQENVSYALENLTLENLTSGNLTLKNTINKEYNNKEYINHHSIDSDFEAFWNIYPRKIGKGAARKAYEKALTKTSVEVLFESIHVYANKPDLPDLQFIPHPTTWLNQERWNDDQNASGVANATTIASDILTRGKALQQRVEGMKEIEH